MPLCPFCNALRTPGATFCLTCFMPFDEAPAAAPAEAAVATVAGDFFAAPPPVATATGSPYPVPGYGPPAPMVMTPPARRGFPTVAVAAVAVVLAVVGLVGWQLSHALADHPKQDMATAFREGTPPHFVPTLPDFGSQYAQSLGADPESPGQAAAYVGALDPLVRAANAELLAMQGTLARWAKGRATDDDVRTGITALRARLRPFARDLQIEHAPTSTRRGVAKLTDAATDYDVAMGALLDWLDSHQGGSKITYTLSVGNANVHWDEGVLGLYRAGGMPAPALPHPAQK